MSSDGEVFILHLSVIFDHIYVNTSQPKFGYACSSVTLHAVEFLLILDSSIKDCGFILDAFLLQFLKQSATEYINNFDPSMHVCIRLFKCLICDHTANGPAFIIIIIILNVPYYQAFPQRAQLEQQYCDKVYPEPHSCPFKDGSVKNVLPDPDVPHGCDPNSSEYNPLH